jgi:hypothetical protein
MCGCVDVWSRADLVVVNLNSRRKKKKKKKRK